MRYIIPFILAAFLSLGFLGGSEADAANNCNCVRCQQARAQRSMPQQNVFQKLMELERKKNAWLRRTFLGR